MRNELESGLGAKRDIEDLIAALPPDDKARLDDAWWMRARPDQLPPPGEGWLTWLVLGGRGAGKT
ncbi:MAG: DNA-packaging protein, partial [Bauldia sp.]|nr:DNA-packaging protein [Bauldia sp.]